MTLRRVALAALLTGTAVPAIATSAAAGEPLRPRGDDGPLGTERLSDERTLSRWAHPLRRRGIRRRPSHGSRRIGVLRLLTEDRHRRRAADGRVWVEVRIPARPNGRTGLVARAVLGPLNAVETALTIDRRRSRATLRRAGRRVWRAPIGHGAPGTATPKGRFYIRERIRNLTGDPLYGPWAFGTSAYSDLSDWPGAAWSASTAPISRG